MLEALERHPGQWERVAQHVATKSQLHCMTHFLQLPIEEAILQQEVSGCIGWGGVDGIERAVGIGPLFIVKEILFVILHRSLLSVAVATAISPQLLSSAFLCSPLNLFRSSHSHCALLSVISIPLPSLTDSRPPCRRRRLPGAPPRRPPRPPAPAPGPAAHGAGGDCQPTHDAGEVYVWGAWKISLYTLCKSSWHGRGMKNFRNGDGSIPKE